MTVNKVLKRPAAPGDENCIEETRFEPITPALYPFFGGSRDLDVAVWSSLPPIRRVAPAPYSNLELGELPRLGPWSNVDPT